MRKLTDLPSLSRVAPGAKATLEIPTGPTYYRIDFMLSGTDLKVEHIGRIAVLLNGRERIVYGNLQRLITLNKYWKLSDDTAEEFSLHFFRRDLREQWQRAPGIGTEDVQNMHIEIQLANDAPADIEIKAFAKSDPVQEPLGAFIAVREVPFASSVAGMVEVDKLTRGPLYACIHLFNPGVNRVELELDQVKVVDATKAVLERDQRCASVPRDPQSAVATHLDFITEGDLSQTIVTGGLRDFRLKMHLAAPGSVDIVTETLDVLA